MADGIKVLAATGDAVVAPEVATDDIAGKHYQKLKAGWGADGIWHETADVDGERVPMGGAQIGALTEAPPSTDTAPSGLNGRLQRLAQLITTHMAQLPATLGQKAMAASLAVAIAPDQTAIPATQSGAWIVSPGNTPNTTRWKVDARERAIAVVGGMLNRPANATPYAAGDAISNNATPASVTAQSFLVSDTADAPVVVERLRIHTTDTGLAAGCTVRAYLYAGDPIANTGIVGGDNSAFSTKRGSFVGSLSGAFKPFSDGGVAVLVPDEGARIVTAPTAGGQTLFVLYQTLSAFTPSAVSTTLTPTLEGFQALA